jgi:hypothetical protein
MIAILTESEGRKRLFHQPRLLQKWAPVKAGDAIVFTKIALTVAAVPLISMGESKIDQSGRITKGVSELWQKNLVPFTRLAALQREMARCCTRRFNRPHSWPSSHSATLATQ